MQSFRALRAPPPDPVPPAAGGFAPKLPTSGGWGLRPQTPIGLLRLGAPLPDPQISPPHCKFLATRLGVEAIQYWLITNHLSQFSFH